MWPWVHNEYHHMVSIDIIWKCSFFINMNYGIKDTFGNMFCRTVYCLSCSTADQHVILNHSHNKFAFCQNPYHWYPIPIHLPGQGWGLLSQFSPFCYFPHFLLLSKQVLAIEYRIYIWQVSPQLSCGDTCQIWMWFRESSRYFCKIENFAYGEISEQSFSNPHPWSPSVQQCYILYLMPFTPCTFVALGLCLSVITNDISCIIITLWRRVQASANMILMGQWKITATLVH